MYSCLRKSENLQKKQSSSQQGCEAASPFSKNGHRSSSDTMRYPSSAYLFSVNLIAPFARIDIAYIIIKNSPKWGVWRRLYLIWRRLHLLLQSASLPAPSVREPYFASLLREGDRDSGGRSYSLGAEKTPSVAYGASSLGEGAYIKFKMILAEKTPSSAVKSYIPSYLLVVEITERMPMP